MNKRSHLSLVPATAIKNSTASESASRIGNAGPIAATRHKSAAEQAIESLKPWTMDELLDDPERVKRLCRWAIQMETLQFARHPRQNQIFAEITIPPELGVSRQVLSELVNLLRVSDYDADAPEPMLNKPQKLLLRSRTVRGSK